MAVDLDVANEALVLLGIPALSSLSDPNDRSTQILDAAYETTVRGLMDAAPWGFLVEYQPLVLEDHGAGDPPWTQKKAAWQFPTVATALWRIQRVEDGTGKKITEGWEIIGSYVHFAFDPKTAGVLYYEEREPASWPPLFREAAVASVAAKLAIGHVMPSMATAFFGLAQDFIELQRSNESYSAPNKRMGGAATGRQ